METCILIDKKLNRRSGVASLFLPATRGARPSKSHQFDDYFVQENDIFFLILLSFFFGGGLSWQNILQGAIGPLSPRVATPLNRRSFGIKRLGKSYKSLNQC